MARLAKRRRKEGQAKIQVGRKMKSAARGMIVWSVLALPMLCFADHLEVRRNAAIYAEPDRHSEELDFIRPDDYDYLIILHPLQVELENGYYNVRLREGRGDGWVYRTRVRRFRDQEGSYVPYKRSLYGSGWRDADRDCQDTRAEVLIRDDDDGDVRFRGSRTCVVDSGTWLDPFTGITLTVAGDLDIDHMVPLKNAHESGGWAWSSARKRDYANYLETSFHLLAVDDSENQSKGERAPNEYLPPDTSFHCEYVQIWLDIKYEWGLRIPDDEVTAIEGVLNGC
jgi:hypothetical protein